jgi:hypothetical protein
MHIVTVKLCLFFLQIRPVINVVHQNEVRKFLCMLKSFQMKMRKNMLLYFSLEYSQCISKCAGVYTGHVVKVHKGKINIGQN